MKQVSVFFLHEHDDTALPYALTHLTMRTSCKFNARSLDRSSQYISQPVSDQQQSSMP